jgi:hypothetical protein
MYSDVDILRNKGTLNVSKALINIGRLLIFRKVRKMFFLGMELIKRLDMKLHRYNSVQNMCDTNLTIVIFIHVFGKSMLKLYSLQMAAWCLKRAIRVRKTQNRD